MTDVDLTDQAVVISVVYDGPPGAGKTTSVRALARSFGREVYTPEERNGRTVYFDWLDHVGGRFEGSPIRCQIVSVPGQKRWTRRRGHFMERADVVVFVGDTTAREWPETVDRLAELRADLDRRDGAPVGLVFQANKRDLADAISIDEVRAQAANARTAVIESCANDGTGVREAFVFAVRLALDRVREDQERGRPGWRRLGFGRERRTDLFELLQRLDHGTDADDTPSAVSGRLGPSSEAAIGSIWPPIEGRILLRDAAPPMGAPVEVSADGDWIAGTGSGWLIHSSAGAVFADPDTARAALLAWARMHASAQNVLSRQRCIVLADAGEGRWRLWQIVRRERSLRELATDDADRLVAAAASACEAVAAALPCTLDTIGVDAGRAVYLGLMPVPR